MTTRLPLPDDEPWDNPKRKPVPDHIPRMEVELTIGDADCAECGGRLRRLSEDVTEELEYIPGRSPWASDRWRLPWLTIVNRITRPRFACSGCDHFTQAPLPSRPIECGRPGPGLPAHVLISKYADHLPLYWQSQIYERDGLDLDRSTLAGWVGKSTALLEPLAEAIGRHVRAGQAIFADVHKAQGSAIAGEAIKRIAYTLIETAKLNGIDPQAWLAGTLARIPDYKITKIDDLLPWNHKNHPTLKDAA